jgi:hypothetical protein
MAAGFMLLGWGSGQLALANKRKKLDSENTAKKNVNRELQVEDEHLEKQLEKLDKSGSMKNALTDRKSVV